MDEHTLNDLLECSVCLERLDTSSKVLPCQHTFCRKCLEVIISSHQELRCPECRVLVDIKIDDLPPNVLLMRILEGMRNTKTQQKQTNLQNIETDRLSSINKSQQQLNQEHKLQQFMQQKKTQQQQQQQQQTNSQNVVQQQQQPRRSLLPHAYAMHDFESTESSDLAFKKGDLVLLKRKIDDNWCVGQANGVEGTFPINYVKVIVPLPSPQCIALYDFKMGPNEEEGCLSFKKGDIIHVFRRVDHNWAEGRIGGTIGIFPIAFVRLNALAEQMLDVNQRQQMSIVTSTTTIPTPTIITATASNSTVTNINSFASNSSSDSCSTTPNQSQENTPLHLTQTQTKANAIPSRRSSTEETSTTSDEMMMLGASGIDVVQLRYREGREKRHSLNALLNDTPISQKNDNDDTRENARSLLQSNRHSAEILSLPHEINTDVQVPTPPPPQQQQQQQKTEQTRVNVLKSPVIVQQMIPPTLPWGYLALYPYKPRKNDELELKKGCVYIVTERCLDGWFKGKNWQDTLGVFPGNYVTPLRPRDQKQLMHQWKHVPLVSMAPITTTTTTLATTTNRNNLPILQIPPPDAPPRQMIAVSPSISPPASTTSCASVWTKPLGHTVEAFFSRSNLMNNNNNNNHSNTAKVKEKDNITLPGVSTTTPTSTSTSNAAVSLMKRLTNIKSRSKSPAHHLVSSYETNTTTTNKPPQHQPQQQQQSHAVHVRSGSCPSQLLQNMPKDRVNSQQQQHLQQQTASATCISYGSQRLKGCKERPTLTNARQSLDANMFRNVYQQQQQYGTGVQLQSNAQYNFVNQNTSQTLQAINHRKSQSLDANSVMLGSNYNPMPPPMPTTLNNAGQNNYAGRYRCIVPYPPNSEFELELHVDDIIFVNRKPKNGWLKGTCVRTNKTGLFPASFVEPICAQKCK